MASKEPGLQRLLIGFKKLLQTGQLSDLTICSADRKYAVHKAVVCPHSTFLWSACSRHFQEGNSGLIELLHDDPNAVHCTIQYFYTLEYPNESAIAERVDEQPPNNVCADVNTSDGLVASDSNGVVDKNIVKDGKTSCEVTENSSPAFRDLRQDLRVYALAEKYGIFDLKIKAAQHFERALKNMKLSIDIFEIIHDVYSTTLPQDRGLRDIMIVRVHSEIQHWVTDKEFMALVRDEGDFCAELLAHTVKEDLKQYEAAIANIEHPGYCNQCLSTLVIRRSISRRKNVHVDKYCAKCDPRH